MSSTASCQVMYEYLPPWGDQSINGHLPHPALSFFSHLTALSFFLSGITQHWILQNPSPTRQCNSGELHFALILWIFFPIERKRKEEDEKEPVLLFTGAGEDVRLLSRSSNSSSFYQMGHSYIRKILNATVSENWNLEAWFNRLCSHQTCAYHCHLLSHKIVSKSHMHQLQRFDLTKRWSFTVAWAPCSYLREDTCQCRCSAPSIVRASNRRAPSITAARSRNREASYWNRRRHYLLGISDLFV